MPNADILIVGGGAAGLTTAQPGLYFLGYVYSPRGHLFEASIASRKLARAVARYMR